MRHKHLACLTLLSAFALLSSCSKPQASPEPQKAPAESKPSPPTPTTAPASAAVDQSITANIGDPTKFRAVMTALQQATQKHDAPAVAALVSYPIDINPHTKQVLHILTPDAFIAQFDRIVTPHIAEVIEKQKYKDLFVNYQGAMFGSGEVWIAGICKDNTCKQTDIKIRTIQNTEGRAK
jgi:hypothetical protein